MTSQRPRRSTRSGTALEDLGDDPTDLATREVEETKTTGTLDGLPRPDSDSGDEAEDFKLVLEKLMTRLDKMDRRMERMEKSQAPPEDFLQAMRGLQNAGKASSRRTRPRQSVATQLRLASGAPPPIKPPNLPTPAARTTPTRRVQTARRPLR